MDLISLIAISAVYCLMGLMWCHLKWFHFLHHLQKMMQLHRADFMRYHEMPEESEIVPAHLHDAYENELMWMRNHPHWHMFAETPVPEKYRQLFLAWMLFWPLSVVLTLLKETAGELDRPFMPHDAGDDDETVDFDEGITVDREIHEGQRIGRRDGAYLLDRRFLVSDESSRAA